MLARAKRTARLKSLENLRENKDGILCHRNGVRYEEIMDDLDEMRALLERAGLKLEDIGTSEAELSKLKAASVRLNASHAAKVTREESDRRQNSYGYDDE